MDSILNSIKKLLGIAADYTQFDSDIVMHINAVFLTLYELGVGPDGGFSIGDASTVWSDYIADNDALLGAVKVYVYQKVRLAFDPPSNSALIDVLKSNIAELEWRMNVLVDPESDNGFGVQNG